MFILATDTSGKQGSIALARAKQGSVDAPDIIEVVPLEGGTFSGQLVPQIAQLLKRQGISKNDVGAFAAAAGPGSFTGLRVGLSAIKGLAEALGKPIVAVSLLEVLALASGLEGKVRSVLDAGRAELYLGEYEVSRGEARLINEKLEKIVDLPAWALALPLVTAERAFAERLAVAGLTASVCGRPNAGDVARLGWKKLEQGKTVPTDQLDALYIRRSDAEIFSKPIAQ